MTALEAQRVVYQLTKNFFQNATVQMGRHRAVKPDLPCVIITIGPETRSTHPVVENADGVPVAKYPISQKFTFDLFTNGSPMENVPSGYSIPNENSAVSDLQDFLTYLDSPSMRGVLRQLDVSVLNEGNVQDVSAFIQDVDVDFRARCELTVNYLWTAAGAFYYRGAPIGTREENASGGGSAEIGSADTGYFIAVDEIEAHFHNINKEENDFEQ